MKDRVLVGDEEEQIVLSRIKKLLSEGRNNSEIIRILNQSGIRPRYGEKWFIPALKVAIRDGVSINGSD
jgi:hypothetical protein